MKHHLQLSEKPKLLPNIYLPAQAPCYQQAPWPTDTRATWGIILGSRDTRWNRYDTRRMAEGPLVKYPQVLGKCLGKSPVYYCCFLAFHRPAKSFQVVLWWVLQAFLTPVLLAAVSFCLACTAAWLLVLSAVSRQVSSLVKHWVSMDYFFMLVWQTPRKSPHYWWILSFHVNYGRSAMGMIFPEY